LQGAIILFGLKFRKSSLQSLPRPLGERRDHGTENIALLRKIALNLAKRETSRKIGVRAKLRLAGLIVASLFFFAFPNDMPTRTFGPALLNALSRDAVFLLSS
jgi:hypothetical protein